MTRATRVVHHHKLRILADAAGLHLADPKPSMEASANHLSFNGNPRCGACNDVLGVYEPLVRALERSVRHTSRAAEPHLRYSGEGWYHRGCYESLAHEL